MSSSRPSLAELRAVAQPPTTVRRTSGEHWAGVLYMRRLSLHLTRLLVPTRVTPDGLTAAMIGCGLAAAAVLMLPSLWAAIGAALLVQLQELLDCSDGELARWRHRTGPVGIYLDRVAHYVTDAGLAAAVGVSAAGGPAHLNGWTTIGLGTGMLVLVSKAETDLVHVARAAAGLPPVADTAAVAAPRRAGLVATGRRVAGWFRFNRALLAIEMSGLAVLAGIGDAVSGTRLGFRTLDVTLLVIGAIVAVGHLLAILASSKLRPDPPR
jgi:phosphatidylglycerophosphate synthase